MEKKIKVLIACEESQEVCKAFRERGFEAYSCDLLECSGGHPEWHIKDDVLKHLDGWDLIIAHPTCTYLTNSGVRWLYNKDGSKNERRWEQLREGAEFFLRLLNAPCPRIVVENPIMHKHAVEIIGRRQDQLIQPWMFGHGETKATCFWIKGLPHLAPTKLVSGRDNRIHMGCGKTWGSEECRRERSKTFPGVAKAMAKQWGDFLLKELEESYK